MGRAVDGHGQLPLPGSEGRHGKLQLRHGRIARLTVGGLAACPDEIVGTLRFEKGLQFGGRTFLHQHGLLCAADLEIDQRQLDPLKTALLTQQMTVDPCLGPMQCPMMGAHAVKPAPVGLDLFELLLDGIKAIGPAANLQLFEPAAERQLRLVAAHFFTPFLHHGMAFHALQRTRRGREAQIQITAARSELAQRAYCHAKRRLHDVPPSSRHCT